MKITPNSYLAKYRIADGTKIIFLDDDSFFRKVWAVKAQKLNRAIQTYSCEADLYAKLPETPLDETVFFLDENLKEGEKGQLVANRLYEKGAREIFCVTGDSAALISATPSVRCVLPKDFPTALFGHGIVKTGSYHSESDGNISEKLNYCHEERP